MWKGFNDKPYRLSDSLLSYYSFDEKVLTVDIFKSNNIIKIVCGLINGDVAFWRLSDYENDCKVLYTHADEVTNIHFNETGTKIVSCALDRYLYVCDVDTGMILFKKEHPNCLICLSWCFDNDFVYAGDNAGFIYAWNMRMGEQSCSDRVFNGPITSITSKWCADDKLCRVIVAGVNQNDYLIKAFSNK